MKGIPFKQWEVQAHNEGRKSSFVRVIKPANPFKGNKLEYCQGDGLWVSDDTDNGDKEGHIKDYSVSSCWISWSRYTDKYAPCQVGDILYIKETFRYVSIGEEDHEGECLWEEDVIEFKASQEEFQKEYGDYVGDRDKWQPSIHMPEEAARSFIRITSVKIKRLGEITENQAKSVGIKVETNNSGIMHRHGLMDKWNDDNPKYPSTSNPWVWVYEYERVNKEDANAERN